ncbi:MmcQ/YjbR family DNA-binding protein [Actinoplanes sp. NPDC023936]|uniref:MmcQ/YjbR family DNA-binding protein n=1 Tax=Actinoplanes sp. NPDC023936 TaxID=3154910 RepID=UPI0033E95630
MSRPGDVPPDILDRLRSICDGLPETREEPAWIGVRWRIRARTFAHVYVPDLDRYPAYARHQVDGEAPTVMTFRAPAGELLGLTAGGFPFVRAEWGSNVVVAYLGDHTDWTEITEVIIDSYCEMAPKFLGARVGAAALRSPDQPA